MSTTALRHITRMIYGDALAAEVRSEGNVPVMSSGGVTGRNDRANTQGPCIVVGRKGSHGSVHWSDQPAFVIDTAYAIDSRTTEHELRWVYYLLKSLDLQSVSQDVGVPGLSREAAYAVRVPAPPALDGQRRIADFLDDQVARLDRAIALRQRQRQLTQERLESHRDALIDELDAQYLRVGQIANFLTDGDWIESPYITDSGIRLIQTGNVGRGEYRDQGFRYISDQTFVDLHCTPVLPGDVLVSRLSPPVGRACSAPAIEERMIASVDVAILRSEIADHRYLVHYFSTRRHLEHVSIASRGATMARISRSQLAGFPVPVPDRSIQVAIADQLDEAAEATARTTRVLASSIELLQERKQALITAAVSGQLDVTTARAVA